MDISAFHVLQVGQMFNALGLGFSFVLAATLLPQDGARGGRGCPVRACPLIELPAAKSILGAGWRSP